MVSVPFVPPDEVARRLAGYAAAGNSQRKAAAALGISREALQRTLKREGLIAGEMAGPARDGGGPYVVKGVSTYIDRDGNVAGQWVKTAIDQERRDEAIRAAFAAMAADLPRLPPVAVPAVTNERLLNVYTITDGHVGALCWHREGGQDWDLKIAERDLFGCFEAMVMQSPAAGTAVISQLGDLMHFDGLSAVTPTSGHLLDADGRFQKVVEVAVRLLRRVVDLALMRHDRVHVIMAEGNHDMASSVWLRVMFKSLYENDPRVTVDDTPLPYYVVQHGNVMLAFHHGHLKNMDGLPLLFASKFPKMWGATTKRYGSSGHKHHKAVKEYSGMLWTQHPTLAAPDAYAARGGWMSEQAATATTYHSEFGEVGSVSVCPEMLRAAA